jgi:flagellar M-ring protein FliF
MIAKSLGPGHAAVVVNATLDFSTGTTDSTKVTPLVDSSGNQLKNTEQSHVTKYVTTGSNSPTGILGPGTATPSTGGASTKLNENQGAASYAQNTRTDHVTNDTPTVKSLSIAAEFDKNVVNSTDLTLWRSLIAAAAGINTARGDQLKVEAMTMDKATQQLAQDQFKHSTTPTTPAAPLDLLAMLRYVVTLLIIGIVLLLAWRSVKKAQTALGPVRVPLDLAALEGGPVNGAGYANELAATLGTELPRTYETRSLEPSRSQVETEVTDLIERQPEDVAQTLRSWLADRRA